MNNLAMISINQNRNKKAFSTLKYLSLLSLMLDFGVLTAGCSSNARELEEQAGLECREFQSTGSRFTQRVCNTPEQWAEIDADAERPDGFSQRSGPVLE